MSGPAPTLDLDSDVVTLTAALCDVESVSGHEDVLADAVESALEALPHLRVTRLGNTVVARTELGRAERVVIAGHLDTVPLADPPNLPSRRTRQALWGRGTVDMKGGVAIALRLAGAVPQPARDVTFVFYDGEEVAARFNGLGRVERERPELVTDADFAVLMEPTDGRVEGGCNGTLRAEVLATGVAAHSARPWRGHNAVHEAATILTRLTAYEAETVTVDGLDYRESMQAVGIHGGTGANVIPDACVVTVNYRYAPDKSPDEAEALVRNLFDGYEVTVAENAAGARPGLDLPAARAFLDALGVDVVAKQGWTDVARFSAMGVPAVNFGPGDPGLAHHDEEQCPIAQINDGESAMLRWLS